MPVSLAMETGILHRSLMILKKASIRVLRCRFHSSTRSKRLGKEKRRSCSCVEAGMVYISPDVYLQSQLIRKTASIRKPCARVTRWQFHMAVPSLKGKEKRQRLLMHGSWHVYMYPRMFISKVYYLLSTKESFN